MESILVYLNLTEFMKVNLIIINKDIYQCVDEALKDRAYELIAVRLEEHSSELRSVRDACIRVLDAVKDKTHELVEVKLSTFEIDGR